MATILYGKVHKRADFDKVTRLKGTQTRIAQSGKEFFLLDTFFRVIGIFKTYEKAKLKYYSNRSCYGNGTRYLHLTLVRIKKENKGRCSEAACQAIFASVKNKDCDRLKIGDTFKLDGVKWKVRDVRSVYYHAENPQGTVYRIRISNVQ